MPRNKNIKKVLVIDADLRKGRQHRIFRKSNRTGLSDLLKNLRGNLTENDVSKIEEELTVKIQDTEVQNVYLLSSGPIPFNPSELLGTANIEFLLDLLKKEFSNYRYSTSINNYWCINFCK